MKKTTTTTSTKLTTSTSTKPTTSAKTITNTKTGISTTEGNISKREFTRLSFNAYLNYVSILEGKATKDTFDALRAYFALFGFDLTVQTLAGVLTISMATYGSIQGEKTRKVKSIATFRKFTLGGWKEVTATPWVCKPGNCPPAGGRTKKEKALKEKVRDMQVKKAKELGAK